MEISVVVLKLLRTAFEWTGEKTLAVLACTFVFLYHEFLYLFWP